MRAALIALAILASACRPTAVEEQFVGRFSSGESGERLTLEVGDQGQVALAVVSDTGEVLRIAGPYTITADTLFAQLPMMPAPPGNPNVGVTMTLRGDSAIVTLSGAIRSEPQVFARESMEGG
jgi:hypothetical protein